MKKSTPITSTTNSRLQKILQKAINKPREAYAEQRYNMPLFVTCQMFDSFRRHNTLGLSASLSFYAMFALIPLMVLLFFLLSQLVFSSDYAIVKLAIMTSELAPKFSSAIMVEVYNTAQQKIVWGAAGLIVLIWAVTPLAGAMRSTFYTIATLDETPSFIRRKVKDIIAVIGMLIFFILFSSAGLVLEKVINFLGANNQFFQYDIVATLTSLTLTTLLISAFYFIFFPVRLYIKHILIGALFTAILWLLMRPAFSLFLSVNESYGSLFGSMKNLFISITWLYFNFSVFLLGTELIATLRKKDVLILKELFSNNQENKSLNLKPNYLQKLMQRYGRTYQHGEHVFSQGDSTHNLHYVVNGQVQLIRQNKVIRTVDAGDYFGEMALLSDMPTIADAVVSSEHADVVLIYPDNIETLLLDEPKVAMKFLRQMATRLQMHDN
jgi:membrane protein